MAAEHGPEIDGAAVKAMTYTEAVVREILRLHPIAGGTFRRALQDFDLFGYYVPKVAPVPHKLPIIPASHARETSPPHVCKSRVELL